MFRQRPNVPPAPPALGQGGWGPRGQGLGGYNQGPGGGMGIYQGAGQGYPDTGMGMRGGYQGGFPASLNPDLPFYRGQPPPDYGGYQVSAQCSKVSQKQFYSNFRWEGGRWDLLHILGGNSSSHNNRWVGQPLVRFIFFLSLDFNFGFRARYNMDNILLVNNLSSFNQHRQEKH